MALRTILLVVACAAMGCKDSKPAKSQVADLNRSCEQLGMVCGDKDKHIDKLVEECTQNATKQVEKGCGAKATALYDCYQKELCTGKEKVWALEDLRVLGERHKKCVAEHTALTECVGK